VRREREERERERKRERDGGRRELLDHQEQLVSGEGGRGGLG
jgi:hypothetical protein